MPVYSMTAYGFGEHAVTGLTYACEIRTLNSRFLEVSVRLPRPLIALETDVINHVKAGLKRGKVDVFCDMQRAGQTRDLPALDPTAVRHYLGLMKEIQALGGSTVGPIDPVRLLTLEGVLEGGDKNRVRGPDAADAHKTGLFSALEKALGGVRTAREKEGGSLVVAMRQLTAALESDRAQVAGKHDAIISGMHKSYMKRLENVLATLAKAGQPIPSGVADERLVSEVALLAEKADIDEELTRLKTHIAEFDRQLGLGEDAVGRKLDFLCQEMHREVNTMSNKLVQTDAAQYTVEMKQTVERLRQQVQNIE